MSLRGAAALRKKKRARDVGGNMDIGISHLHSLGSMRLTAQGRVKNASEDTKGGEEQRRREKTAGLLS